MSAGPVGKQGRQAGLDIVRGVALLGVLLVNLLTFFRASLFEHILVPLPPSGAADQLVQLVLAAILEFRAFTLLSVLFGIGLAAQASRVGPEGGTDLRLLLRRLLILLGFGAAHMLLVANADILLLYAVCGLLALPALRAPPRVLLCLAVAVALPSFLPIWGPLLPLPDAMRQQAAEATRVYAQGGFLEILRFRWSETLGFILPLLAIVLPRTAGLMLLGMAAWRGGWVDGGPRNAVRLRVVVAAAGAAGAAGSVALLLADRAGLPLPAPRGLLEAMAQLGVALALGAALLAWRPGHRAQAVAALLAAMGRTALSNYLLQSAVLTLVFYGYGFGLFGRLSPAEALPIGLLLGVAQLLGSAAWLRRFRFGPAEWLWRSLVYGRRLPMRCGGSCSSP